MYSGFLNAGPAPGAPHANMNMHYVFIESERSPSTDPLVVWCAAPSLSRVCAYCHASRVLLLLQVQRRARRLLPVRSIRGTRPPALE